MEVTTSCNKNICFSQIHKPFYTISPYNFTYLQIKPIFSNFKAKSSKSNSEHILKPKLIEQVLLEDEDELSFDDLLLDGDFEDDYLEEEEAEPFAGDGEGGGGISLAGTPWDKEVLALADEVVLSFEGDLGIYAFKTLLNFTIRVRIEKLSNKSGSPAMEDVEAFSEAYRKRLDEAELAGSIPENISLEVSSPGVERMVRVPQDLDRFKERAMYVKYLDEAVDTGTPTEKDGVFRIVSFNLETNTCTWGIADVRVNREKAGKGRPLNKKQREWRLETPFDSICLVRLYSGN